MKVHYSTPYGLDGNIGKAYNEYVRTLPADDWVCLRDGDTMFLHPEWGRQVQAIAERAQEEQYSLLGCKTNRLRSGFQMMPGMEHVSDMKHHHYVADEAYNVFGPEIYEVYNVLAAFFWLMPVKVVQDNPFPENTIHFDSIYCRHLYSNGHKLGLAVGLYVYHLYRIWSNHKDLGYDYQHLLPNKQHKQ